MIDNLRAQNRQYHQYTTYWLSSLVYNMVFLKWLQILKWKKQNSVVANNNADINDDNKEDDKNNDLNIHCSIIGASHADDNEMFDSFDILQSRGNLLRGIERIKLESKTVSLRLDGLDNTLVKRLGVLLRQNTTLTYLSLTGSPKSSSSVIWLCLGLELNHSIETLFISRLHLRGQTKMYLMGSFLAENNCLKKLSLNRCGLIHKDINCLGDKLLHRSSNTLEELDLGGNFIGDNHLDGLVTALIKMSSVKRLNLGDTYIAGKAVNSLKRLLESNSAIEELDLSSNDLSRKNSIDAEAAVSLIRSLQHNNTLKHLNFGRKVFGETDDEWWSGVLPCVLQLICDTSSINNALNSNHTLSSIGPNRFQDPEEMRQMHEVSFYDDDNNEHTINPLDELYDRCLGDDLAQWLHSSYCTNYGERSDVAKAQRKIIRCHTRGDFNIGEASIDVAALPQVLSLFCDDLDAFFRIVNARPDLCAQSSSISSLLRVCQKDNAYYQYEIGKLQLENKILKICSIPR